MLFKIIKYLRIIGIALKGICNGFFLNYYWKLSVKNRLLYFSNIFIEIDYFILSGMFFCNKF
jgi:hypothetical protein